MSIDPSYAPVNETSGQIWIEVSTLIGDSVLGFTAFGVLLTLYAFCLSAIIPQLKKPTHRKWAIIHIVYCTLIVGLVGVGNAGNARLVQIYWINNRNFPGGPLAFLLEETSISTLIWCWSTFIVASWLQDGYVIYRCLVFWNWNYWVCGFPILCYFGSLSTSIALIIEISNASEGLDGTLAIDFAICWYIFSVTINILGTVFIVGRLLWKRRTIQALLGKEHSKLYTGIMAMLIESAAVYSVFGLIFIGTYFVQNPVNNIVLPVLGTLEGICPLMIIYRVSSGRGWTSKTTQQLTSGTLASLAFKPNPKGSGPVIKSTSTKTVANFSSFTPGITEDFEMDSVHTRDKGSLKNSDDVL